MVDVTSSVTRLLAQTSQGSLAAQDRLFSLVYSELHRIARAERYRWRPNDTPETGELVNEAYIKLVANEAKAVKKNRAYFFAAAARAMRQLLIDYHRKWTPPRTANPHTSIPAASESSRSRIILLDKALRELRRYCPSLAQIVEYRIFAGLTTKVVAELCGISTATVERRLRTARAFLRLRIEEYEGHDD